MTRQVCLPVPVRRWRPHQPQATTQQLARMLIELVAATHPDRSIHVVAAGASIGKTMRALPAQVTITTRPRADAARSQLPPSRTGRPGRPAATASGCPSWSGWPP
jgi:hypothetical protein